MKINSLACGNILIKGGIFTIAGVTNNKHNPLNVISTQAEILVKQAVRISKTVYGDSHIKYADSLVDYG